MYRSPGSASSPDLATLLRKKKRQESPHPSGMLGADQSRARLRSTSTTPSSTSSHQGKYQAEHSMGSGGIGSSSMSPRSPDWILTSPRGAQENGSPQKQPKASVRAKTSAFLGKIMGQGITKDRTRIMNGLTPTTPTFPSSSWTSNEAPPPVPPLPNRQQSIASVMDVFTDSISPHLSKPLPSIQDPDSRGSGESDNSIVMVDPFPSQLSPSPSLKPQEQTADFATIRQGKRRSMSVNDAEYKKQLLASLPPPRTSGEDLGGAAGWASTLTGILTDFSNPDAPPSLPFRDPSTPDRRLLAGRSKTDPTATSCPASVEPPVFKSTLTSPISTDTLTFNVEPAALTIESPISNSSFFTPLSTPLQLATPTIPPRLSSLQTPPSRSPALRFGPRPAAWSGSTSTGGVPTRHASQDVSRLRVQHRSNASNSEPSLLPRDDDTLEHDRSVRLVPSINSIVYSDTVSSAVSPITPDLSTGDLLSSQFRSTPSPAPEDESDIDTKAKVLASRCWNEDEEFLAKEKIAEWLGGHGRVNNMALGCYMENFDFSGLRLDIAFRRLCTKLYLKAETQQVDRILEAFASRYWACNLGSVLGSPSVVHAVAYSLLLLNTDLHVADLNTRMSRNQFVRNTLSAIQTQLQPNGSNSDPDATSVPHGSDYSGNTPRRMKRSDSITSWNSISRDGVLPPLPSAANGIQPANESTSSFPTSNSEPKSQEGVGVTTYDRNWENEMESLLKDMYTAIKNHQVLQPLGSSLVGRTSTSSLTPHGTLLRNRSGRGPPDRLTTLKRGSIRGLQTILGTPGVSPYSSNSSIDGRISPAPSFATSTEMHGPGALFLAPTLGFASNLSHSIIRETQEDDSHSVQSHESGSTTISITDEELALLGAPWAKEGMLCRKQFWETTGKKAKARSWMDVFVVIQKGELNMFTFGERGSGSSGVVGGGNWLENAQPVGTLMLAHALAHALPPPGYNRQRPHCIVLTLGNGGVYFFQAGTEELVNEWVSTCNYWAARQSKEPLAGGVSNMEYGWNRVADSHNRASSVFEEDSARDADRSDVMSVRSGRSRYGRKDGPASIRSAQSPWADRLFINDWKQPLPPSVASTHDEETQLEALQKHVNYLNTELQQHNELRVPMSTLYTPRSTNATKALTNWENKSKYLLSEIVKYQSYIDSLQHATTLRLKKRGEKALERALVGADPDDDDEPPWSTARDDDTVQDHGRTTERRVNLVTPTVTMDRLHRREIAVDEDYED